ncbi:MAG: leucine-rich repeat domain-containing protein [Ruminococcus sp.]|nr:leucine-rich repeat domain-containing protein [Ruminococcus sp.]
MSCKALQKIKIPSSVTEIYNNAFKDSGLKSILIGKNVKYISYDAFENSKLTKITVSGKNKKYSSKSGVLYNKKKTRLIIYPNYRKGAKFTTPSSVEQIKPYAFSGSKFLKKAVFSKKIKKISTGAFDKCKNLKSLVFKSKKKIKIAPYAFLNCKALKSVTIPKNVIKIATKSFGFTSRLEKNHNDYTYKKIKGFTIKGKCGSAAHKYAKKYKFKFVKK